MAKFKFNRINWKNILIISLALVLGIGAIAGVSSLVKNEKTTLSSLEFKRGALNDLGFYIESETSIYTKDLIECQGLEIEPDFETIGTYQVYYYDSNKQFIGKTDKINSQTDGVYVKGDNYRFAKYCRIVITPEVPKDEDGNVIDDYKIKFYEVAGIAGKYKISVDKEQNFTLSKKLVDGLENKGVLLGKGLMGNDGIFEPDETTIYYFFDEIDVSSANVLILKVKTSSLGVSMGNHYGPVIFDHDSMDILSDGLSYVTLDTDGDFTYIICNVANVDNVIGFVDSASSDCFEIYLCK